MVLELTDTNTHHLIELTIVGVDPLLNAMTFCIAGYSKRSAIKPPTRFLARFYLTYRGCKSSIYQYTSAYYVTFTSPS